MKKKLDTYGGNRGQPTDWTPDSSLTSPFSLPLHQGLTLQNKHKKEVSLFIFRILFVAVVFPIWQYLKDWRAKGQHKSLCLVSSLFVSISLCPYRYYQRTSLAVWEDRGQWENWTGMEDKSKWRCILLRHQVKLISRFGAKYFFQGGLEEQAWKILIAWGIVYPAGHSKFL